MADNPVAAIALFSLATSITPGPNNAMLLASGVNWGFRRTLPHMLGVSLGFALMLVIVGFGFGEALRRMPQLQLALQLLGSAYLLFLAWKIATTRGGDEAGVAGGKPFTFGEAAAFQWVNPKAWMVATGAAAAFVRPDMLALSLATLAIAFTAVGFPCIAVWAGLGGALRPMLAAPSRRRAFNIAMGVLLALSVVIAFPSAMKGT